MPQPLDITQANNLEGKVVLLRSSLNVPFTEDGKINDDFRLKKSLPTVTYLQSKGAKIVMIGHVGRDDGLSLEPIYRYLRKHIKGLRFVHETVGDTVKSAVTSMGNGDVILLENLRRENGEVANDLRFAEELAQNADVYVNDAFSVSHREHASITGLPFFLPSYAGLLFRQEYEELSYARSPEHPALFILGGAKFRTKQPLVEKFLTIYDHVLVAGALANDFFKAEGHETGTSLVSDPPVDVKHLLQNQKLLLPQDVVVLTEHGEKIVKKPEEIVKTDMINDLGPKTLEMMTPIIQHAEFILWNGPTGDYEKGFFDGTKGIVEIISRMKRDAVVGGGDTMSLVSKFGYEKQFSFCSTAGGAMLDFLLDGRTVGIEALLRSQKKSDVQ